MMKNLLKQNMDTQHIIGAMTTVELKNWKKRHKMVIALFLLILTLSILAVALSFFLPKESLDPLSQLQKTVKENSQNIVKLNSSYQDLENLFEESSREIEKLYNLIEINCKKGTIKPKDGRPQFLYSYF